MITTDEGRFNRAKNIKVDKLKHGWLCHDPKKKTAYMVTVENRVPICICGDKFKRKDIMCKHIVAVGLLENVEIKVLTDLKKY